MRLAADFPRRRPGFKPGSGLVGFVMDNVVLGQIFSKYFGFPFQSSFHQLLHNHHHLSIVSGWYKRPIVAAVPSGLSLTPVRIINFISLLFIFFQNKESSVKMD
jgi:hypothetical protein